MLESIAWDNGMDINEDALLQLRDLAGKAGLNAGDKYSIECIFESDDNPGGINIPTIVAVHAVQPLDTNGFAIIGRKVETMKKCFCNRKI